MTTLLTSLCNVCHAVVPKYTCPRCSMQTCSLACSRRHKTRAACNGVRDPTVYKPRAQLATPSGIDHDYNFLHGIEYGIERSEKRIVEDRGLVRKEELECARNGPPTGKKAAEGKGEACIARELLSWGIKVEKAPKGMRRAVENGSTWSRSQKCINWQLEWLVVAATSVNLRDNSSIPLTRVLSKALGKWILGDIYREMCEEERRKGLSEEERRREKKRRAEENKEREKRRKEEHQDHNTLQMYAQTQALQDPHSSKWNISFPSPFLPSATNEPQPAQQADDAPPQAAGGGPPFFYLVRPHTPSSSPKVLIPLAATASLSHALASRCLLEFPTIYVLTCPPDALDALGFLSETAYLRQIGADTEDHDDDMETSETSSSGTSSEGEESEHEEMLIEEPEEGLLIEEVDDDDEMGE